jgi:ketosteroid isomerase-like protein
VAQENVEIALRAIDAWNRQDLKEFLEVWHRDAEWRPALPEGTQGSGTVFRGHESIEQAWHNVREAWAE